MPYKLIKDNVYKYSADKNQISIYCCQAFTVFQKSYRKIRELYLTDQAIYIISGKKLKVRIPLVSISKVYVGLLAGEFFLVTSKRNLIIDCAEGRSKFVQNIKLILSQCHIEYINFTTLDFLFEKHSKINSKIKLTQYDPNQKKVQLKYIIGQKLNLRQLKKQWEKNTSNNQFQNLNQQKYYKLNQTILTNTYWNIFLAQNIHSKKQYTIKLYSKKYIAIQPALLQSILNERKFLQTLVTSYTPSLVKAFYSQSRIYFVYQLFNGYLLQTFNQIKKHKLVNLLSQIIIAVGQLHEAGLVYRNLSRNGIMIGLDGYAFLFNMGFSVEKKQSIKQQIILKPPQACQQPNAQFGWDWWNLAQLIFQLVQKKPFYENIKSEEIQAFLSDPQDKLPLWIQISKWEKQDQLLNLFKLLLKKNPKERLGFKNDYHQILHHKYFENWLKQYSKSLIMKKQCPPVVKNILKPVLKDESNQCISDQDWSQMNEYLKGFDYFRDIQ